MNAADAAGSDVDGATSQAAAGPCAVEALAGRYGFLTSGHRDDKPHVAGGVLELKDDGSFALQGSSSTDGTLGEAAPSYGSFSMEGCRGTLTGPQGEAFMEFSVAGDGHELRYIVTEPMTVLTGVAKRVASGCTASSVVGSYAYGINAIVYLNIDGFPMGASPFAGGGSVIVKDDGTMELVDTASIAGQIFPRSYMGSVTVEDDCTGSAVVMLPEAAPTSNNPVHVDIVWVEDGKEVLLIQRDEGTFIAGSARQQPADESLCSMANLEGRYGFLTNGDREGTPHVAGGVLELKADGSFTLQGSTSTDGMLGEAAPSYGDFSMDGCRGSLTDPQGEAFLEFSVVGEGEELRYIVTEPMTVLTGMAKRVATGCTASNVVGSYAYGINAIVYLNIDGFPMGASPFAGGGAVIVTGDGTMELVDTASIAGQIFPRSYSGSVTVEDDCTGSAMVMLPEAAPTSNNPVHVDIVWVDGREEAILIQRDEGTFIAGSARQQPTQASQL
ncbi:MAG: hypothetical protein OEZ06_32555 [Myxococcales bacterium]|nr:hypothetical protein [Myxococcales bacterium]